MNGVLTFLGHAKWCNIWLRWMACRTTWFSIVTSSRVGLSSSLNLTFWTPDPAVIRPSANSPRDAMARNVSTSVSVNSLETHNNMTRVTPQFPWHCRLIPKHQFCHPPPHYLFPPARSPRSRSGHPRFRVTHKERTVENGPDTCGKAVVPLFPLLNALALSEQFELSQLGHLRSLVAHVESVRFWESSCRSVSVFPGPQIHSVREICGRIGAKPKDAAYPRTRLLFHTTIRSAIEIWYKQGAKLMLGGGNRSSNSGAILPSGRVRAHLRITYKALTR